MSYPQRIGTIHAPGEPTLQDLLHQAGRLGQDRVCLVKRRSDGSPPGLCILLLGRQSIRDAAPWLLHHCRTAGPDGKPLRITPGTMVELGMNTSLRHAFQWMQDNHNEWCHGEVKLNGHPISLFLLYGECVTDHLAAELTRRGILCKLT